MGPKGTRVPGNSALTWRGGCCDWVKMEPKGWSEAWSGGPPLPRHLSPPHTQPTPVSETGTSGRLPSLQPFRKLDVNFAQLSNSISYQLLGC